MNNSLKIGIVAGLIAGIVGALIRIISISIFSDIGLPYLVSSENISKIASFEISIAIIWGIILGLVYMKARHVMPEGTILKSLLYGFFCFLLCRKLG
ncbi:MAG: hypothetical protein NWF08_04120 [Candidatus Bathyarchaeota archaeon]|nr:hypothetical protein [Candidatus Bathyarchaeota archaeon]